MNGHFVMTVGERKAAWCICFQKVRRLLDPVRNLVSDIYFESFHCPELEYTWVPLSTSIVLYENSGVQICTILSIVYLAIWKAIQIVQYTYNYNININLWSNHYHFKMFCCCYISFHYWYACIPKLWNCCTVSLPFRAVPPRHVHAYVHICTWHSHQQTDTPPHNPRQPIRWPDYYPLTPFGQTTPMFCSHGLHFFLLTWSDFCLSVICVALYERCYANFDIVVWRRDDLWALICS